MPTAILILSSGLRRLGHKLGFFISVSKSVPSTCSRIWRFQQIIYVLSDLSVSSSKTADLSVSISNTADLSVATSNTTLPKKAKWQREHSPPRSLSWSRHRRRPGSERDVLREVFGNLSKATVLPPLCVSSPLEKEDLLWNFSCPSWCCQWIITITITIIPPPSSPSWWSQEPAALLSSPTPLSLPCDPVLSIFIFKVVIIILLSGSSND